MNHPHIHKIFDEITHSLRYLKSLGINGVDCSESHLNILEGWERSLAKEPETLKTVRRDLGDCKRCRLCKNRRNIVFGSGNPAARLVFVGEGPGADEDREGEPFVGAAGALLTKIIHAMKLTRDQVYICNIIKCRPPANRDPGPDEIDNCFPFLERQLSVIRPQVICALGAFAARTLLSTDRPISQLRGRFHKYKGIDVMPTYHPAFLLRNPEQKRAVWEDVQKIMKALDMAS